MPFRRTHERQEWHAGEVYPIEADTLLLLDAALREVKAADRVLEVGTGSGYIAAEIMRIAPCVIATEINPYAVRIARSRGVWVVRTDLTDGIMGRFDLILFNPPYLPTPWAENGEETEVAEVEKHGQGGSWLELALDGGPKGRDTIERFASSLERILAPGGRLLLLISSLTGEQEVRQLFEGMGFAVVVVERIQYEGEELMVMRISRESEH